MRHTQMMKTKPRSNTRTRQLLAGWLALLLYAGASSPLGVGIVAVFGTIDPDHKALLQMSSDGICLVLQHEQKCVCHEHHMVARMLTFFAQPAENIDPDHVVKFASAEGFWRDSLRVFSCEDSDIHADLILSELSSTSSTLPRYSLPPLGPPPDTLSNLICLRSTVLLI